MTAQPRNRQGKVGQRTTPEPSAEPKPGAEPRPRVGKAGASTRGPRKPVPADYPGAAKVVALADAAAESGWTAAARTDGSSTIVIHLTKGERSITVTFSDGKLDLERMPAYIKAEGARPVTVRNISAVKRIMEAQS